ncbi:MAG: PBS lyase HEAT domain protein repeat-containing protein [Anaerolineales bacterium]|jgi:HEAT repeat protein|nr:PBS lyase HEAT domain protein repeat-containing protein [Anaerolineales bacterium]MBM2849118.1 lyase domain protein repeat-containing protein [Anaerolineales bacterium]
MNPAKPEPRRSPRDTGSLEEKAAWEKYFDYLIKQLKEPDANTRMKAAQILGENREPRAVEPLGAALADPDSGVRQRAAEALGRIGAPALKHLITALDDPEAQVRQLATKALGQIGGAEVVEPLVIALRSPDADVSHQAAFALNKIGAPAVEALIAALRDRDPNLRWNAARLLGEIGDARAAPELKRVAQEDEGKTRSGKRVAEAAKMAVEKVKSKS